MVTFYNKYREALSFTNCDLGQIIIPPKLYFLTRIIGIMMPPHPVNYEVKTLQCLAHQRKSTNMSSLLCVHIILVIITQAEVGSKSISNQPQHSCCHSAVLRRQLFYILHKLACFKI